MQIEEDVIRPLWITSSEICIILHIIWKANLLILFYHSFFFGTVSGYKCRFCLADTPQKVDNIH